MGRRARRLSGSADLYETDGREPFASINFITAHDGFTLRDLVSYNEKHNEANGEDNNDGESHNRSWNCGAEGPTDDPGINELRARQQRNFLTTLLLSQGVPMICHGDELGRTQNGNNNGYCQDNELTWIDWAHADAGLLEFTRMVSALRADHPVFRRRRFFSGKPLGRRGQDGLPDIAWFTPEGTEMTDEDWGAGFAKSVAVFLNGHGIPDSDARGQRVFDDSFLLCFNAHDNALDFVVPEGVYGKEWTADLDTSHPVGDTELVVQAGEKISIPGRSVLVLRKTA